MMRRIIATSLRFRFIVIALAAFMLIFGAAQVRAMPVDVFPEFAPPKVEIQTICIGLSAEEVEQLVTVPIEQSLAGIEGLETIRSKSVIQLSQVVLLFKPGTNELKARQLVAERIAQIAPSLPTWAAPPVMLQPLSATSRVMKIGITSDSVSQIDMSMTRTGRSARGSLRVKGVANVAIWGEQLDCTRCRPTPADGREGRHARAGHGALSETLDDGLLQFNPGNFTGTGGFVDTPNQRLVIRHIPPVVGVEDLSHVTVPGRDGQLFPLTDVVELVNTHQPLIGEAVINDGPGVMLIVEKFPWANTLDVTRGVEDALEQLSRDSRGSRSITTIFRPASFIELAMHNLSNALILGSVLVFVILILFLFEWRTALISLVAIPLSLMAAAMVLWVRDVTINTMVLAGFVISVGVVVDDAIIDVENITRRLRQARLEGSPRSTASIVLDSSLEVRSADRLRDADRRHRGLAGVLHQRAVGRVLPATGDLVRPGHPGVARGGTDRHAGPRVHPPAQRADRASTLADHRSASRTATRADRPPAPDDASGVPHGRHGQLHRSRAVAAARSVPSP